MGWVERDFKDQLIPAPFHGKGHFPLEQIGQSPIQPGIEHFAELLSPQFTFISSGPSITFLLKY